MFFGLTNSPATFQTIMDNIFEDLISEGVVVVYLDDILIFMETLEEHHKITHHMLELLEKHKLYLHPDKCKFEKTTIEYLGVIISHNSVVMDLVKITGITEWPAPTNKRKYSPFSGSPTSTNSSSETSWNTPACKGYCSRTRHGAGCGVESGTSRGSKGD